MSDNRAVEVLCIVWHAQREPVFKDSFDAGDDSALEAVEEHLMREGFIDNKGWFTNAADDNFHEDRRDH